MTKHSRAIRTGALSALIVLVLGTFVLGVRHSLAAPNTGDGGGNGNNNSSATNAISQGDSNVTITDGGAGGKVEIDADGFLLFEVLGATQDILIGNSSSLLDDTTILSDLLVNGIVTADGFTATQDNGSRGANFKENTSAYSCTAVSNGFDIFADSTGVLNDLPLWCDQTPEVHEFTSHGVRGASPLNPRLSLIGVENVPELVLDASDRLGLNGANVLEVYTDSDDSSNRDLVMAVTTTGDTKTKSISSSKQGVTAADLPWIVNQNGIAKFTQLKFREVNDTNGGAIGGNLSAYFDAATLTTVTDSDVAGSETSSLFFKTRASGTLTERLTIPSADPFTIAKGPSAATSGLKVAPFVGSGFMELNAPEISAGTETHVLRHKTVSFVTASATVANAAFRDGLVIVSWDGSSTDTDIVLTLPTPSIVGIGGNVCISYRSGSDGTEVLEVKPDAASRIYTQSNDGVLLADGLSANLVGASICLVATTSTSWQTLSMKKSWTRVVH